MHAEAVGLRPTLQVVKSYVMSKRERAEWTREKEIPKTACIPSHHFESGEANLRKVEILLI
jgi:hypothetical protein